MRSVILIFFWLTALAPPLSAAGADDAAMLCEWASQKAADETGVPADILGALTLTETGRNRGGTVRPWAWSVNAEGSGSWFDDPDSALAFARDRVAKGRHNLDIGCFQINYRWHGEHFPSLTAMFDPLDNARYAARFVSQLYAETGDWRRAAGAFHSRTPRHATRYLARFDQLRNGLKAQGFGEMQGAPESYNRFASADPSQYRNLPRAAQRVRIVDNRMLLGAPEGTGRTGMPGSLAAIGGRRTALLDRGSPLIAPRTGPLIGAGALPPKSRRRKGRAPSDGSDSGQDRAEGTHPTPANIIPADGPGAKVQFRDGPPATLTAKRSADAVTVHADRLAELARKNDPQAEGDGLFKKESPILQGSEEREVPL